MIRDMLEVGIAQATLPGELQSGDRCHVRQAGDRALIGVVDGLGHGAKAAIAAEAACEVLNASGGNSVTELMLRCHERLRETRGAAMTLLDLDLAQQRLEWLGVGNIAAVLLHPSPSGKLDRTELLVRGGVVGVSMPPPVPSATRIVPGDMLVIATDGVDAGFADGIDRLEPPRRLADRLLGQHRGGHDDALVVVARVQWGMP